MKVIAYGSLMNQPSLEQTLNRAVMLRRLEIFGYQRVFNAPFSSYAYANLEKDAGARLEAAYFEMDTAEVAKFATREAGSNLVEVRPGYFAFIWPLALCRDLAVLQSYLDVCATGAQSLGLDFWLGTARPTDVINDRAAPRYLS